MAGTPRFTVRVGTCALQRVESLRLRLSLRELADSFSVQVADRVTIPTGAPIEISIEGRTMLVGEVQDSRLQKGPGVRDLTVSGFSSSQRLAKSSVVQPKRVFVGLSLRQLCEVIVAPFGLGVDVSEAALEAAEEVIDQIAVDAGEGAFEFLSRAAKRQGCILASGTATVGEGESVAPTIQIARLSTQVAPYTITYPSPRVLSVGYEDDVRDVHSHYYVTRRGRGTLDEDGTLKGLDGTAVDERVPYSPLILQAEKGGRSQQALNRQAEWEMRRRAAEGQRISVSLEGWSPDNSRSLWLPNTLYRFVDAEEGFNAQLLVSSVELSIGLGGQGAVALLELMPPDAYAVLEQPKPKIPKKKQLGQIIAPIEMIIEQSGIVAKGEQVLRQLGHAAAQAQWKHLEKQAQSVIYKPEDPDA